MKRISEEEKQNILNSYKSRQPIQPLLFHTDNGSNYKSRSFMTYLKGLGVTQSFSRPHVPYDYRGQIQERLDYFLLSI